MTALGVIEGEIVEVRRTRQRNAARIPAILPPDVDTKVVALRQLDSESQERHVTLLLEQARAGLVAATGAHHAVEWKAKAAAIHELTKQLRLGRELQLDAAEFCRIAERRVGLAIREGQATGTVLAPGKKNFHAGGYALAKKQLNDELIPGPLEFATASELSGANKPGTGIYAMTDGVSDQQFNEVLAEARAEGNLSRANVARKAKAKAQGQVVPESPTPTPPPPPAEPKARLTKHDSTEMLANINGMLNGIVEVLPFVDPADIDLADNRSVIRNIHRSMAQISALLKEIKNNG